MTSEQQETSPAPAETSSPAPANQAETQTSPAPAPAAPAASPAAAEPSPRPAQPNRPRIKIGTQREGVATPRIPPRVTTVFRTPEPGAIAKPVAPPPPAASADERTRECRSTESAAGAEGATAEASAAAPTVESEPAESSPATPPPELVPKPMQLTPGKAVRKIERIERTGRKFAMPNLAPNCRPIWPRNSKLRWPACRSINSSKANQRRRRLPSSSSPTRGPRQSDPCASRQRVRRSGRAESRRVAAAAIRRAAGAGHRRRSDCRPVQCRGRAV